jgi:2,4-dienoyl-CoA reductase-like NADH-dependent reductase (Old Yellow Enzyme family)
MDYSPLFQSGTIGELVLKNRIVKSPQTTGLSNQDGTISQRTVNHYKRLAEGGTGLVLVEYSYIDDDAAKSIHAQVGVSRREHIPGLGWLADEVHAVGAKIGLQLAHCGRQRFLAVEPIKSASNVSWDAVERQYGVRPKAMTLTEINHAVSAFGDAAQRVVMARFDLVEIHAAHGYLITNFLSPHTNRRTDEYGGSFENRARILMQTVADVRRKIPRDFPLSVRLSVVDYEEDGIKIEETVDLCRQLEAAGVDVIHASGGHHARMDYEASPWFMPRALHRWGWEKIKEAVSIPVIASGSLVAPDVAVDIVSSGSADFVSLGRAMLADPDWARKTRENRVSEIVPCIRCNDGCLHRGLNVGRSTGCTVNPSMGYEYRFPINRSKQPEAVAVVGAGPAGLKAAATLADKGHRVTLFEANELGGLLIPATRSPLKQDLRSLLSHLIHEVKRREISIERAPATVQRLRDGQFNRALLATGVRPRLFRGADSEGTVLCSDTLPHDAALDGPIVIIGGGVGGCDTALWLQMQGHRDVILVEQGARLLSEADVFTDQMYIPGKVADAGIKVRLHATAMAYDGRAVSIRDESAGQLKLSAATVISAIGHEPELGLFKELQRELPDLPVELIGTACGGARVFDALHGAFFAANRI